MPTINRIPYQISVIRNWKFIIIHALNSSQSSYFLDFSSAVSILTICTQNMCKDSCLSNQRTTSERDGDIKDHMEKATIVRLNVCSGSSFNNSATRDVLLHHTIRRVCIR